MLFGFRLQCKLTKYSSFKMSIKNSDNFSVCLLSMKDRVFIEKLLQEFLENEVMTKHMKLAKDDKQLYIKAYVDTVLPQGLSIGIVDKATGEVCACMLNSFSWKAVQSLDYGVKLSKKMISLSQFDEFMERNISVAIDTDNYILIEIAVVTHNYQKQGLFYKLYQSTGDIAKKQGVSAIVNVSTSVVSIKVSQKYGFQPIKEVLYKDYFDQVTKEAVFAGIPYPNTKAVLFAKKLVRAKL